MTNNLVPIMLRPLRASATGSSQNGQSIATGRLEQAIRRLLNPLPTIRPVSLETLEQIVLRTAEEARALSGGIASFRGLILLSLSIFDAFGNAVGAVTPSALIASVGTTDFLSVRGTIAMTLIFQSLLYAGGLVSLRASPWRYWIRRALHNSIPSYLGGDQPTTRSNNCINIGGSVVASLIIAITAVGLPRALPLSLVLAIPAGPLLFLVLRTVVPIMVTRDRPAVLALTATLVFCGFIVITAPDEWRLVARYPHDTPLTTFLVAEFWLGYGGVIVIISVLFGSWCHTQVFRVRLDGPNKTSPSVHLPHLVGVPAAAIDVEFDGGAPYLILARSPPAESGTRYHSGAVEQSPISPTQSSLRPTGYHVVYPLERVRLNEKEISVHNLAPLSTIEVGERITTGASMNALIVVQWPHASKLADELGSEYVAQEVSEWLSAQLGAGGRILQVLKQLVPALAELPRARLNDQLSKAMVRFARLSTDLNRPTNTQVLAIGRRRTDRVLSLAEQFVITWNMLDSVRNDSDAIVSDITSETLIARWQREFGHEISRELVKAYKGSLSEKATMQIAALLRPIEVAATSYISTTLNFDDDVAAIRNQQSELEQQFRSAQERLRTELDAAVAEEEGLFRATKKDELRRIHERRLIILGALRYAVLRSNSAARDIIDVARNLERSGQGTEGALLNKDHSPGKSEGQETLIMSHIGVLDESMELAAHGTGETDVAAKPEAGPLRAMPMVGPLSTRSPRPL